MDGIKNGLFTEGSLRVWDKGRFEGGYHHFCTQIAGFMPPTQSRKRRSGSSGALARIRRNRRVIVLVSYLHPFPHLIYKLTPCVLPVCRMNHTFV